MIRPFTFLALCILITSCNNSPAIEKIHGVNLEMPPEPIDRVHMEEVKNLNVKWVSMIPYAFIRRETPEVIFKHNGKWWGETVHGTAECIRIAHEAGLKVMMKPHVWVSGQGWAGEFSLDQEASWKIWEDSYREYVLTFARLADSLNVELFCIGTEYRKVTAQRPQYWRKLINEVREVYDGQVTYAANWDEYENVSFWDELDFIGVDAYFPLSEKSRPTIDELNEGWKIQIAKLETLSKTHQKPILFTEYGYQSIEYTNSGHWNYQKDTVAASMEAQATAYEALFQSTWTKEWMAGGFFWKWHFPSARRHGDRESDYTPQGKITEEVIRKWYGDNQ